MASRSTRSTGLKSKLGDPPRDSLGVVSYAITLLGELLVEVRDQPGLSKASRRRELLAICDRLGKLRDLDRIYQAERTVTAADELEADSRPGPELTDAGDLGESARPLATRRARAKR